MPLTYAQLGDLTTNISFGNRVKVAALDYAQSITIESASTPFHGNRLKWANQTIMGPDAMRIILQPPVVMDPAIRAATEPDASDVTDVALQSAVEGLVNRNYVT